MIFAVIALIVYFLGAISVKTFYKLKYDPYFSYDSYMVGFIWPLYLLYKLAGLPFIYGSSFVEKKFLSFQQSKKVRVVIPSSDREIQEAEEEIEEMLAKRNSL